LSLLLVANIWISDLALFSSIVVAHVFRWNQSNTNGISMYFLYIYHWPGLNLTEFDQSTESVKCLKVLLDQYFIKLQVNPSLDEAAYMHLDSVLKTQEIQEPSSWMPHCMPFPLASQVSLFFLSIQEPREHAFRAKFHPESHSDHPRLLHSRNGPHIYKSLLPAMMERAQVKDLRPRLLQLAPWARRLRTMEKWHRRWHTLL
jgi:hypothetical protein